MATDSYPDRLPPRTAQLAPLAALIAQLGLITILAAAIGAGLDPAGWVAGIGSAVLTNAALSRGVRHFGIRRLGAADWVTLTRASLAVGVAALVSGSFAAPIPAALLVVLAASALALDAVDGWVARRTPSSGRLGARYDGEVDAFLILVLSVYVARSTGIWVLLIGAMRYAALLASWPCPWLRAGAPPRYWRKTVAALQGVVLVAVAADVTPGPVNRFALLGALALLTASFGEEIWWLRNHRTPESATAPDSWRQARRGLGVACTVVAGVVVWAALVAPDQPKNFTLLAFLRIPLELLVLVALAVVLPKTPRRILAGGAGLLLAALVVMKVIDYEMYANFDRPYDPLGDTTQLGNGIETLRSLVGGSETRLIEWAAGAGVIVSVLTLTFAMLRVTRVAADNHRWALRGVGGIGAVWALCWVLGVQLIAHTPVASTLTAGFFVDEVNAIRADIHDKAVFAAQIRHDPIAKTPASRLLTDLKGKDVVLVSMEAYGQEAVEGKSFSPEVDAALSQGDRRLADAGFASRSGFLTSATFGGISWLAHSSFQTGLWVDNQHRYNQLLSDKRFTLTAAFKKAGWRTVDDVPSNEGPWPQGQRFYGWDKIYNRHDVGYHGPTFTYASMPDQYTFAALNRLELGKPHKQPLFAEVDTVSSHMPWNRIPEQVPWNKVGNGSIFNTHPELDYTGAFWSDPPRVQAAYGKSIVYSMNTLTSFVQNYGKKNLVMIVLGDHQPLPIVSGTQPNHDVPISIISHDPKILRDIKGWGWNSGLQPARNAPVWRMSAFRNKFLNAFDAPTPALSATTARKPGRATR